MIAYRHWSYLKVKENYIPVLSTRKWDFCVACRKCAKFNHVANNKFCFTFQIILFHKKYYFALVYSNDLLKNYTLPFIYSQFWLFTLYCKSVYTLMLAILCNNWWLFCLRLVTPIWVSVYTKIDRFTIGDRDRTT